MISLSLTKVIEDPPLKSIPKFNLFTQSDITLTVIKITVNIIIIRCFPTKSTLEKFCFVLFSPFSRLGISLFLTPIKLVSLLSKYPVFTNKPNNHLVKNTIITIVTSVLIINIVANPLTLLSPKIIKIIATKRVVTFESKIDINEFLLPFL